jgi:integrase
MMRHAVEIGLRDDDPTRDVRRIRTRTEGHHTWSEREIAQFEARYPAGTAARLAMGLLLFTGQRPGDVSRMGRQHVHGGAIHLRQEKTGAELAIPIHPDLQAIIDATMAGRMTFLVTKSGKPFTPAGFGNWFKDKCYAANLPHCSAHGLRKAAAVRLAEAACTLHEIAAITGHRSLREVARYTAAADQKRLAVAAIAKVKSRTSSV